MTEKQHLRRLALRAEKHRRARAALDEAIVEARQAGMSTPAIGRATGFSHRGVQLIIERTMKNGAAGGFTHPGPLTRGGKTRVPGP